MKKLFYPLLAAFILLTSAALSVSSTNYKVGPNFQLKFTSKDPSGIFKKLKGTVIFDEENLAAAKFNFTADVSSISTGNGMQNKKAQTQEWFYASKYPEITFVSSKVTKAESKYYITGNFTIKGVTKEIKVPMTLVKTDGTLKFKGSFYIDRLDFKVGKPNKTVPSRLKIHYLIPVTKS